MSTCTATPVAGPAAHAHGLIERCDQCGARAATLTRLPSGRQLAFCGHHYRLHSTALAAHGAEPHHLDTTGPPP